MTHKIRHKQLSNIKKKYKNLAGIVAAATILSTATLPGLPATIAHASASPNSSNMSATTSQQIGKTNDSGMQLNFNASVVTSPKDLKQESKVQPSANTNKISDTASKPTEQANPNAQPDSKVVTKAPDTAPKPTEQVNPNAQPDSNVATKAPDATPKPTEQLNPNVQPDPNVVTKAPDAAPKPNVQPDPNVVTKAPDADPKPTEQLNPNVQPDPNIVTKAPDATPKPTEQLNPNVQPDPNVTTASPGTPPTNYKHVLDIKATAYAPGPHDNGQWGNKTHIGSQVRPGIIAVDPNVIPLGSQVYIQYPDGHGEYAIAEDTGGAIKGNRVDIAKWTVNEAEDFGIQNVKVFVVSTPEKV